MHESFCRFKRIHAYCNQLKGYTRDRDIISTQGFTHDANELNRSYSQLFNTAAMESFRIDLMRTARGGGAANDIE